MSRYRQPYTLYKRGKYWYYKTYTINGIRTVGKTTGKTSKAQAKEYLDNLYLNGTLISNNITFKDYSEHFFDDDSPFVRDRVKPLSKNTLGNYRDNYRNHISPNFANYKLNDITYTALKKFRSNLLEKYSSNHTRSIMATFKLIIRDAYRDGLINNNPFDFLDSIQIENNQVDAFTLDEIKYLYNSINDIEFSSIILLLTLTGMRISEGVGIRPEDIKTSESGFLYIDLKEQLNKNEYKQLKRDSRRKFPIIPEIVEMIGFPNNRLSTLYMTFKKLKEQFENEERPKLSFHSLRHFFITNCISIGIPESKVNYFTGHRQKGVNQVYINYKPEDLIEFLDWQRKIYKYITE